MAYSRLLKSRDGRQYYKIEVSRGRGKSYLSMNWYIPDGWSKRCGSRVGRRRAEGERSFPERSGLERRRTAPTCGSGTLEHTGAGRRRARERSKGKERSGRAGI